MTALRRAFVSLAVLAVLAACSNGGPVIERRSAGGPSAAARPTPSSHGWTSHGDIRWIIARSAADLLGSGSGLNADLVKTVFDTPRTNEMGRLQPGWSAQHTTTFPSFAQFQSSVASVPSDSWVIYDDEAWSFTPPAEQREPATYMDRFVTLAHQHHVKVILTPAVDLVKSMACGAGAASLWQGYLDRCRVPALAAAAHPDAFEIQAQGFENSDLPAAANCGCYPWFVLQAATQARSAAPTLAVYAGLSTNHSGHVSTGAVLYQDVLATQTGVVGYWLNVATASARCPKCTGSGDPQVGIDFLHRLGY